MRHKWRGLARAIRRYREKNATSRVLEEAFKVSHPMLQKKNA